MTKYNRYQKLQKYYMGVPVQPPEYRKGNVVSIGDFESLELCEGYCPTEYRETVLDTISKYGITYTLTRKEKTDDCGNTWQQEGEEYNKFVSYNIVDDDTLTANAVLSDFDIQNQWWFNGTNYELYFCNEDGIYQVNFELKTITLYQTFASATSSFFQQNQPLLVKRNYYYTNLSNNQRYYINNLCFYNFPYYDPVNKKLVYIAQDEDLQTSAKLVIIENDTYNSIDVPGMYDSCTYYYDGYIYYRSTSAYVKIDITDYSIETIPLTGDLSLIANNDNLYYFVYPKSYAIGSGRSNNTGNNVVYDYYYLNNYGLKEGHYSYGIEDVINDTLPTFSDTKVTSRLSGTSVLDNYSNLMMRNEPYCVYILMTQMPSGTGLPTKVFINQGNGYFVNYCVTYDSDRYLFLGIKRNVLLYYNTNTYSDNKLMFVTLDIKENEYHNNGNEVCFGSAKYSILENDKGNIIYDNLITTNSSECNPILYQWTQIDPSIDYICDGHNKYYKEIYQFSTTNGKSWTNVYPEQTRQGDLIEENSQDCIPDFSGKVIDTYNSGTLRLKINNEFTNISISNKRFSEHIDATLRDCRAMFDNDNIEELEISLDTSHVSNSLFNGMFQSSNLKKLTIYKMDTSNATGLGFLFYNCSSLTELDLSMLNVSNVSSMQSTFGGCSSLTQLNISGWDLTNVYSDNETTLNNRIFNCFNGCRNLQMILANGCNEATIKVINAALADAGLSGKVTVAV